MAHARLPARRWLGSLVFFDRTRSRLVGDGSLRFPFPCPLLLIALLEHEARNSIMKSISIFPDHDLTQRQIITQVLGASLAGTLIGCESTFGCKVKPTLNRFTNAEGNN